MASAMNVVSRRRRVSYEQLECLWAFLKSHRDMAFGFNKSAQARDYAKRMWVSITEKLNSLNDGATKDWRGWSNYWVDYKAKLKRRVADLRVSQNHRRGGSADVIPLNDIEKKFLNLLKKSFGSDLPHTQVDPLSIVSLEQADSLENTPILEEGLPQQEPGSSLTESVGEQQLTENQPAESHRPIIRRRRRQPTGVSLHRAREDLVQISHQRLLADQRNAESLSNIAEELQRCSLIWQEMLGIVNRIADVIDSGVEMKMNMAPSEWPGGVPNPEKEDPDKNFGLSKEASAAETQAWLARQRFGQHALTFANFSGADLLRLSRDDFIQICGLADGIRLYNALHAN